MLTIEEKINLLSTNLGVPRLGIRNTDIRKDFTAWHWAVPPTGVAAGMPYHHFPQAYGLGSTWIRT